MSLELDEQAGMSAVFGEEPAPVAASEPEQTEGVNAGVVEDPAAEAGAEQATEQDGEKAADQEPEKAPEPSVSLEDELRQLREQVTSLSAIPDHIRRLDGRYGELHRAQQQMQTGKVQLSPDKFTKLKESFPELAEALASDLTEAFSPAQPAPANPQFDPNQFEQIVNDRVSRATDGLNRQIQILNLSLKHSDWRDVASSQGFQAWSVTQPPEVQEALRNSWDVDLISQKLSEYKASIKKEAPEPPKISAKNKVIQAAVTPAGSRTAMPATDSEADAFLRASTRG